MYPIDHLYRGACVNPDAIAVEDGARGLAYRELVARVDAMAAALAGPGVPGKRARIGICAFNTIEHMVAVLAVYAAEHIWVALNPRNGKPELDAIIEATRLDAIVADENCLDRFTAGRRPAHPRQTGAAAGPRARRSPTSSSVVRRAPARAPLSRSRARRRRSSSPEGRPERPKASSSPIVASTRPSRAYLHLFRFQSDDANLCAAPLTHGSSHYILPVLSVGGRHVLTETPKAPALLDAFEHEGCTTSFMPPTMIYSACWRTRASPRRDLSGLQAPTLRRGADAARSHPRGARRVQRRHRGHLRPDRGADDDCTAMTADGVRRRPQPRLGRSRDADDCASRSWRPAATILPPERVGRDRLPGRSPDDRLSRSASRDCEDHRRRLAAYRRCGHRSTNAAISSSRTASAT